MDFLANTLINGEIFKQFFFGDFICVYTNCHKNTYKTGLTKQSMDIHNRDGKKISMYDGGGSHITLENEFVNSLRHCGPKHYPFYYRRVIEIPDDAQIYVHNNYFPIDKVILGEEKLLSELKYWTDRDFCLKVFSKWPLSILYMNNPHPSLWAQAFSKYPKTVLHMKNPTMQMKIYAIKLKPKLIKKMEESTTVLIQIGKMVPKCIPYMKNPPSELILDVINHNGSFIRYFNNPSFKICVTALKKDNSIIHYLPKNQNFTENQYLQLIKCNGLYIKLIDAENQTQKLCLESVKNNGLALQFCTIQTDEIINCAIKNNPKAILFVKKMADKYLPLTMALKQEPSLIMHDVFSKKVNNFSEEQLMTIIDKNPNYILKIKNPPHKAILRAIAKCPYLINHIHSVHNVNESFKIEAVKQNPRVIEYLVNPNEQLCALVLDYNGLYLRFIHNQTEDMCIRAVKQNAFAFKYVNNGMQTESVCLAAVDKNPTMIRYVKNQTFKICVKSIRGNPLMLQYVIKQNYALCCIAIIRNPHTIRYIKNPTDKLYKIAINRDPHIIKLITNPSIEIMAYALSKDPSAIQFLDQTDYDICMTAVVINHVCLKFLNKRMRNLCANNLEIMFKRSRNYV